MHAREDPEFGASCRQRVKAGSAVRIKIEVLKILAPFVNVPVHIVEAELIWLLLAHRMGSEVGVVTLIYLAARFLPSLAVARGSTQENG